MSVFSSITRYIKIKGFYFLSLIVFFSIFSSSSFRSRSSLLIISKQKIFKILCKHLLWNPCSLFLSVAVRTDTMIHITAHFYIKILTLQFSSWNISRLSNVSSELFCEYLSVSFFFQHSFQISELLNFFNYFSVIWNLCGVFCSC